MKYLEIFKYEDIDFILFVWGFVCVGEIWVNGFNNINYIYVSFKNVFVIKFVFIMLFIGI